MSHDPDPSSASASLDHAVEHARRLHAAGLPRHESLAVLARAGEVVAGRGSAVSILAIDACGLLRNASSPSLPRDYLAAIDGLRPDPRVGTCAAAAATGVVVETPDFFADDKWSELRHLPLALGYLGAWSMPIRATDGRVLGTFGTYYRERRPPTDLERRSVARLSAAAAEVLERA